VPPDGRKVLGSARELIHQPAEARTLREVLGPALQGVLDQRPRLLDLPDPPGQLGVVLQQQGPAVPRVRRVEHLTQLLQAETRRLAPDDHRHPGDVARRVVAAAVDPLGGGEQSRRLPVPQDVRTQLETLGQLADGHGLLVTP
jgi:hypothetical protein